MSLSSLDKSTNINFPKDVRKRLLNEAVKILNGLIECYHYNIKVYCNFLTQCSRELNQIITLLIDTYQKCMHSLALILLENKDVLYIYNLSECLVEIFITFLKNLNCKLRTVKINLIKLEKILGIQGWYLVYMLLLLRSKQRPEIAKIITKHAMERIATTESQTVKHMDKIINKVFDPILQSIINNFRQLYWLTDYLFYNDNNNNSDNSDSSNEDEEQQDNNNTAEKKLEKLEYYINKYHFPNIYRQNNTWYFIIPH